MPDLPSATELKAQWDSLIEERDATIKKELRMLDRSWTQEYHVTQHLEWLQNDVRMYANFIGQILSKLEALEATPRSETSAPTAAADTPPPGPDVAR